MLKVESIVLSLFQLVLGVFSKFALDTIDKNLEVPKILIEESLELWLSD